MTQNGNKVITLSDIRKCFGSCNKYLAYRQGSDYYQAKSQPKWLSVILSQTIRGCMTQNSGEFENSEASNFMNKNLGAPSHPVDSKLEALYDKLVQNDFEAIHEEEKHLCIVLSQCAFLSSIDDSNMWKHCYAGNKLDNHQLKETLSKIDSLSSEGQALSDQLIKNMISELGNQICIQCLPAKYSQKCSDQISSEYLFSVDSIKLLAALIVISLNYKNNYLEQSDTDDDDILTLFIHQYLTSDNFDNNDDPSVSTQQIDRTFISTIKSSDEVDSIFEEIEMLAYNAELKTIKEKIGILVKRLLNDPHSDITSELDNAVSYCRHATFKDNLRFAIKQFGHCERITANNDTYSVEVHLKIAFAKVSLEIQMLLIEIDEVNETLRECRSQDDKKSLITLKEIKLQDLNEKNQESKQYKHELERLRREGITNDSVLSLHISKKQDEY